MAQQRTAPPPSVAVLPPRPNVQPHGRQIASFAWNALVLGGFYWLLAYILVFVHVRGFGTVLFLPLLWLTLWLAVFLHECGHLLAGQMVGDHFLLLTAGPLRVIREQHGLHWSLDRTLGLLNGMVLSVPRTDRYMGRRMLATLAGGPVANLIVALLTGLPALIIVDMVMLAAQHMNAAARSLEWLRVPFILLAFTSASSLMTFMGSLNPFDAGADGAKLWMVLRNGRAATQLRAAAWRQALMLGDQRPREWDAAMLQRATLVHEGTLNNDPGAPFVTYLHALDCGDIARAGTAIDQVLAMSAAFPPAVRAPLVLEAAYFAARYRNNGTTARALLEQAQGGIVEPTVRARAEAAVLLAEGKNGAAATRARDGLALLHRAWGVGSARTEADWLHDLVARAEQAASTVQ